MKTQKLPWLPLAVGQLVLFGFLVYVVEDAGPYFPTTRHEAAQRVKDLDAGLYFLQAESLAKKKFTVRSSRWSHFLLDADSTCREVDNGAWLAKGWLEVPGTVPHDTWEVLFYPDTDTPLFIKVGDREFGNGNAAALRNNFPVPQRDE